jgi:hypothetical protein
MTDAAEAGMVHLRLIAGAEEAPHVLRVLENSPRSPAWQWTSK